MKHIVSVLILSGAIAVHGAEKLAWPKGLSQSDKRDVLALAARMGIADPLKVQAARVMILGDRYVFVEGRPVETAHERRWSRASMFRDDWREYDDFPTELRTARVGRWVAKGPKEDRLQFRIQDGAWTAYVGVPADGKEEAVEYADANAIVLAIRLHKLINAQTPAKGGEPPPPIPALDASKVFWIQKDDGSTSGALLPNPPSPPGLYVVTYSIGEDHDLWLLIRVLPERVELLGVSALII
jgi:hypothetical protein